MKHIILTVLLSSTMALFFSIPCSEPVNSHYNYSISHVIQKEQIRLTAQNSPNIYLGDYEGINALVQEASVQINEEFEELNNLGLDTKEWYIKHKEIENKYSDILDLPETIYDYFSDEELDKLFRVVEAEIGSGYSFEQKCNVASVIWNRLNHSEFNNTLNDILSKSQFATISNGSYLNVEISE